eukprot:92055_1
MQNKSRIIRHSVCKQTIFNNHGVVRCATLVIKHISRSMEEHSRMDGSHEECVLIHGFCRIHSARDIPTDIIQLILQLNVVLEQWHDHWKGTSLSVTDDFKHVVVLNNPYHHSILGTQTVSSGKHWWSFKLGMSKDIPSEITTENWSNLIGIVDVEAVECALSTDAHSTMTERSDASVYFNECLCFHTLTAYAFIGLDNSMGGKSSIAYGNQPFTNHESKVYGKPFVKDGDVLDMYLDLKRQTLGFSLNGEYLGIAFNDIANNKRYSMFVTLAGYGTSLQIMGYS